MLKRSAVVLTLTLPVVLAGCANETPNMAGFVTSSSLAVASPANAAIAPEAQLPRKTMSDRVLTAIALERVTGLKPDPSRLSQ